MEFIGEQVAEWIKRKNDDALAKYLMSSVHHGKPGVPQAIKVQVIALIRELSTEPQQLAWAKKLMRREENMARQVACGLVAAGWDRD